MVSIPTREPKGRRREKKIKLKLKKKTTTTTINECVSRLKGEEKVNQVNKKVTLGT